MKDPGNEVEPIGAYIALPASFFQWPMKNGVLSNFIRSHISSDRVRSGYEISRQYNRPFPNYPWPLLQSESWCSSFHMKISFHSHANEN